MPLFSENTVATLRQFWATLSGWHEIRLFGQMFIFILRKPYRHTIQTFKTIEPADSYRFFVQSFVVFTTLTSLFAAFRGNDILKNIVMMFNQMFFLTLTTILYFVLFNRLSLIKRTFSEFLKLYSLYMGFILPFFALASLLNWQIIMTITDPANLKSAPDPFRFLSLLTGAFLLAGFGLYYSIRINRYFWNLNAALIVAGLIGTFILLTPLQRLWIKGQCALGITPDFVFNSLAHRKATLQFLGCGNNDCNSCILAGKWKWSAAYLEKYRRTSAFNPSILFDIDKEMEIRENMYMTFEENGHYSITYPDTDNFIMEKPSSWFFSEDGSKLFFGVNGYDVLYLSGDSIALKYEWYTLTTGQLTYDTLYLVPAR